MTLSSHVGFCELARYKLVRDFPINPPKSLFIIIYFIYTLFFLGLAAPAEAINKLKIEIQLNIQNVHLNKESHIPI